MRDLAAIAPDARLFVLREYTKRFEEQLLGSPAEVAMRLLDHVRGEITLVVMPPRAVAALRSPHSLDERIDELLAQSHSVAAVAKTLANEGFGERRDIYARAGKRKRARRE